MKVPSCTVLSHYSSYTIYNTFGTFTDKEPIPWVLSIQYHYRTTHRYTVVSIYFLNTFNKYRVYGNKCLQPNGKS
jgi:hypothetical protein